MARKWLEWVHDVLSGRQPVESIPGVVYRDSCLIYHLGLLVAPTVRELRRAAGEDLEGLQLAVMVPATGWSAADALVGIQLLGFPLELVQCLDWPIIGRGVPRA